VSPKQTIENIKHYAILIQDFIDTNPIDVTRRDRRDIVEYIKAIEMYQINFVWRCHNTFRFIIRTHNDSNPTKKCRSIENHVIPNYSVGKCVISFRTFKNFVTNNMMIDDRITEYFLLIMRAFMDVHKKIITLCDDIYSTIFNTNVDEPTNTITELKKDNERLIKTCDEVKAENARLATIEEKYNRLRDTITSINMMQKID
jgi:hypothetical protein